MKGEPVATGNGHRDVSGYALGVLAAPDAARYEGHLARCHRCRTELDRLTPLVSLMSFIDPTVLAGPAGAASAGPGRPKLPVHSHRWRNLVGRLLSTAAAGVAIFVAGGLAAAGAVHRADRPPTATGTPVAGSPSGAASPGETSPGGVPTGGGTVSGSPAAGTEHDAVDQATGVEATVLVGGRQWGTDVTLRLRRVSGPQTCHLVAVSKSGQRETIVGWTVPPAGYGTPSQPDALVLHGATYLAPTDIDRFEVRTTTDTMLVSVPV